MTEWGAFEWSMIILDILMIGGFTWSVLWAKKNNYPLETLKHDAAIPATLIAAFSIVLWLYLFGVLQ